MSQTVSQKARKIGDYFEVEIITLRGSEQLPFSVYLYFKSNEHIIMLFRSGDTPPPELLKKYQDKGIGKIWILQEERGLYDIYLNPPAPAVEEPVKLEAPRIAPEPVAAQEAPAPQAVPVPVAKKEEPPAPKTEPPQTAQGQKILDAIKNKNINEEKKAALVAKEARNMIAEIGKSASSPKAQNEALATAKKVLEDVLSNTLADTKSALSEVWSAAEEEPDFQHAMHVATYASLIAMASGRANPDVIADIALAGILHDIGLTQIPAAVVAQNWKSMDDKSTALYHQHCELGAELLNDLAFEIPPRVRDILLQHHEKFDGGGYPKKMDAFKINDLAQLVSVADLLDSLCSGRFDGVVRSLDQTFETLEKIEKNRTFPEYFNPEIFSMVLKWFRSGSASQFSEQASSAVQAQSEKLLKESSGPNSVPNSVPKKMAS